ncbi:peroxisome assembly protein 12-like [Dysidea avara]|uniref:peroxisome assembly protein 12-like n=1 Tax=Dysidea avara TaxID=196820 RepID=UPI00331D2FFE
MTGLGGAFNEQLLWGRLPSIFELFAQEAMATSLQPAIEYVIKVLTHNFPATLGWVWHMKDEVFLLLNTLMEGYSISYHDASFSEHFYNMKRVMSSDDGTLTRRVRLLTWILLALIPYLRTKLDQYYQVIKEQGEYPDGDSYELKFSARCFLYIYPIIYFSWEGLLLLYRMLYLFQHHVSYSPVLWITGTKLSRVSSDEMTSNSSSLFSLLLGNMLPAVAFSLKFLEWWYSGDHKWVGFGVLPTPPPPAKPPPHPQGVREAMCPSHCALCEASHDTPTTLQTSGYVFCYSCIHDYVRKHGCCPVTRQPTNETQLIRLFLQ